MALRDLFRRKKVAPTERAGTSGTAVWGGIIQSVEKNPKLTGIQKYETYSEVLVNTSIVAAGVRFFLELGAKAGWKAEGPDEEINDQVLAIVEKMETPWSRVIKRALLFKFYGFSWQEWTAVRLPDGTVGLLDVEVRPQSTIERWEVDLPTGDVLGVWQRSPQTGELLFIDRTKSVYLVDDSISDSPEGLGLLRHVVEPARALARYEQLEGFGYELDLRGIPIGRAPLAQLLDDVHNGKLTKEQMDARIQALKDFIERHVKNPALGVLLDSKQYESADGSPAGQQQWGVSLLAGSSTADSATSVGESIKRKNLEIARVLGVEHLLVGGGDVGSLAMSRDKSKQGALLVDSALRHVAETFNHDLVGPVMRLNGWPEESTPKLKPAALQHRDVQEITAALRDLASAGAILAPDDPAVADLRDLLGLSPPPPPEAIVAPPPPPGPMEPGVVEVPPGQPPSGVAGGQAAGAVLKFDPDQPLEPAQPTQAKKEQHEKPRPRPR